MTCACCFDVSVTHTASVASVAPRASEAASAEVVPLKMAPLESNVTSVFASVWPFPLKSASPSAAECFSVQNARSPAMRCTLEDELEEDELEDSVDNESAAARAPALRSLDRS